MGKKTFAWMALAVMLGVVPAVVAAQAVTEDEVIAELRDEGFVVVDTGTTLLGRLRITATGPEGTREVILNTRNGKVLRDVMIEQAPEIPMEPPKAAVTAPLVAAPAVTGPAVTGPVTTGPVTTGPVTTGPVTTGPVTTGPVTTGPVVQAPPSPLVGSSDGAGAATTDVIPMDDDAGEALP